jgi:hypothetical protein
MECALEKKLYKRGHSLCFRLASFVAACGGDGFFLL